MERCFTIRRFYFHAPSYVHNDLADEEDGFCFGTEEEAKDRLCRCFHDGAWIEDEKYGMIRHEVVEI